MNAHRPPNDISPAAPGALALRNLANRIARYAPHDGVFPLRLPGTYALRRGRITSEPVHATLGPSLCIVAQGAKVLMLGREVLEYDPARMLVFAVDLPVSGQVIRASQREPFLGFKMDLAPARVAELAARVYPHGIAKPSDNRGLYVGHATDGIIDAVTRLLDLMGRPEDVDLIGPLVVDEILIRLLRTPIGTRVAQIGDAQVRNPPGCQSGVLDPHPFRATDHRRGNSCLRSHERIVLPPAIQGGDYDEPAAIPEGVAAARSPETDAVSESGCERRLPPRRLSECVAIQPGVRPFLRQRADQRYRTTQRRSIPAQQLDKRHQKCGEGEADSVVTSGSPSACFRT